MARRAQQLDPLSLEVNVAYGSRLNNMGRREEAVAHLQHTIELDPTYFDAWVHLSFVYEAMKRPSDQIAAARRAVDVSGRAPHAMQALARAYVGAGDIAQAEAVLEELIARPVQRNAYELAMLLLRVGQHDRALEWLQRACEERTPSLAYSKWAERLQVFDPVRRDPRFAPVKGCVGLAD